MKEQVKSLWKLCFPEDSDDFVALYFSSRYTDEINRAITENGRVVSALQRIPYPMRFNDAVIPVAYISGRCCDTGGIYIRSMYSSRFPFQRSDVAAS